MLYVLNVSSYVSSKIRLLSKVTGKPIVGTNIEYDFPFDYNGVSIYPAVRLLGQQRSSRRCDMTVSGTFLDCQEPMPHGLSGHLPTFFIFVRKLCGIAIMLADAKCFLVAFIGKT